MTVHQVNGDGAGPYECMIDATGQGTNWQPIEVTQQVPGNNGRSNARATDIPLKAAIPAGMQCTGTVAGQDNGRSSLSKSHIIKTNAKIQSAWFAARIQLVLAHSVAVFQSNRWPQPAPAVTLVLAQELMLARVPVPVQEMVYFESHCSLCLKC